MKTFGKLSVQIIKKGTFPFNSTFTLHFEQNLQTMMISNIGFYNVVNSEFCL
jgi:hypothetical protein